MDVKLTAIDREIAACRVQLRSVSACVARGSQRMAPWAEYYCARLEALGISRRLLVEWGSTRDRPS